MSEHDDKRFENYYNQFYTRVFKFILKKVTNISVAEDLAMDSFVAAYKNFERFDENRASFSTWIFLIANNKLKNYYRDHKIFDELDDAIPSTNSFEEEMAATEYIMMMKEALAKALEEIKPVQKQIIILKYFKNKNSNEISEIVGLTPGNVRVQLNRALTKLKEYFNDNNIKWEL